MTVSGYGDIIGLGPFVLKEYRLHGSSRLQTQNPLEPEKLGVRGSSMARAFIVCWLLGSYDIAKSC